MEPARRKDAQVALEKPPSLVGLLPKDHSCVVSVGGSDWRLRQVQQPNYLYLLLLTNVYKCSSRMQYP